MMGEQENRYWETRAVSGLVHCLDSPYLHAPSILHMERTPLILKRTVVNVAFSFKFRFSELHAICSKRSVLVVLQCKHEKMFLIP